jgi:hypothetical protein
MMPLIYEVYGQKEIMYLKICLKLIMNIFCKDNHIF